MRNQGRLRGLNNWDDKGAEARWWRPAKETGDVWWVNQNSIQDFKSRTGEGLLQKLLTTGPLGPQERGIWAWGQGTAGQFLLLSGMHINKKVNAPTHSKQGTHSPIYLEELFWGLWATMPSCIGWALCNPRQVHYTDSGCNWHPRLRQCTTCTLLPGRHGSDGIAVFASKGAPLEKRWECL